ncbi:MAG: helix-turn-helix domain-containing protein [Methanomassiliicoccales archaeon]|nr:helix-turn-helix domain-containing protein [Methanomassiliicoccales archaeon]
MISSASPGDEETRLAMCRHSTTIYNELSKKWTMPIVFALGTKISLRFNELKRAVAGVSAACLSERLDHLEEMGVVSRQVKPSSPPGVEYALTENGLSLRRILCELSDWADATGAVGQSQGGRR